jgi:hypothetical protein
MPVCGRKKLHLHLHSHRHRSSFIRHLTGALGAIWGLSECHCLVRRGGPGNAAAGLVAHTPDCDKALGKKTARATSPRRACGAARTLTRVRSRYLIYQGLRSFHSLNPWLFSFTPPAWDQRRCFPVSSVSHRQVADGAYSWAVANSDNLQNVKLFLRGPLVSDMEIQPIPIEQALRPQGCILLTRVLQIACDTANDFSRRSKSVSDVIVTDSLFRMRLRRPTFCR